MSVSGTPFGDAEVDGSFSSAVRAHYQRFLLDPGHPEDAFIKVTLVNGEVFYFKGLQISHIGNVPGCVMFRGTASRSDEALVVREDHVLITEFDINPEPISTFGFS